ncbi:MAG: glycosyltransferase family 2 protein [Promethearchaeota archaeon]
MKEPLVSIIISNYNGLPHLKELFDSLNKLVYKNKEIIFIDNCSQDNSVEYMKNKYPDVKLIQNKKDYGFSKANNIAASYANGKYLAFLNVDTVVDENWLTELVKVAESSRNIGIAVSKHYYYDEPEVINYAGTSTDKFLLSHHIGINQKDNELLNTQNITFYACFAAALMRRDLIRKIGLFDPIYYAFAEDFDLSWRTWISGYNVIYVPTSFIFHKTSRILGQDSPRKRYLIFRNKFRTLLKNYELESLIKIVPIYIVKRIGMSIKFIILMKRDVKDYVYANIKALFWNIINLKSLIKQRKLINQIRKRSDNFIFKLMEYTLNLRSNVRKIEILS